MPPDYAATLMHQKVRFQPMPPVLTRARKIVAPAIPNCRWCEHLLGFDPQGQWVHCSFFGKYLYSGKSNGKFTGCDHCTFRTNIIIQQTPVSYSLAASRLYYTPDCRNCRYCISEKLTPVPGKMSQSPHHVICSQRINPRQADLAAPLGANYCEYHDPVPETPLFYKLPLRPGMQTAAPLSNVFLLDSETSAGVVGKIKNEGLENLFQTTLEEYARKTSIPFNQFMTHLLAGRPYLKPGKGDNQSRIEAFPFKRKDFDPKIWSTTNFLTVLADLQTAKGEGVFWPAEYYLFRQIEKAPKNNYSLRKISHANAQINSFSQEKPMKFYTESARIVFCSPAQPTSFLIDADIPESIKSKDIFSVEDLNRIRYAAYCSPVTVQAYCHRRRIKIQPPESFAPFIESTFPTVFNDFSNYHTFQKTLGLWMENAALAIDSNTPDQRLLATIQPSLQAVLNGGLFYRPSNAPNSGDLASPSTPPAYGISALIKTKLKDAGDFYQKFLKTFEILGARGFFTPREILAQIPEAKKENPKPVTLSIGSFSLSNPPSTNPLVWHTDQGQMSNTVPQKGKFDKKIIRSVSQEFQIRPDFAINDDYKNEIEGRITTVLNNFAIIETLVNNQNWAELHKEGLIIDGVNNGVEDAHFKASSMAYLITYLGGRLFFFKQYLKSGAIPTGSLDLSLFFLEIQYVIALMFPTSTPRENLSTYATIRTIIDVLMFPAMFEIRDKLVATLPKRKKDEDVPFPTASESIIDAIRKKIQIIQAQEAIESTEAADQPNGENAEPDDNTAEFKPLWIRLTAYLSDATHSKQFNRFVDLFGNGQRLIDFVQEYEAYESALYHFAYTHCVYVTDKQINNHIIAPLLYTCDSTLAIQNIPHTAGSTGSKCKITIFPPDQTKRAFIGYPDPAPNPLPHLLHVTLSKQEKSGADQPLIPLDDMSRTINDAIASILDTVGKNKQHKAAKKWAVYNIIRIFKRTVALQALKSAKAMRDQIKKIRDGIESGAYKDFDDYASQTKSATGSSQDLLQQALKSQWKTASNNADDIKKKAIATFEGICNIDPLMACYFMCRFDLDTKAPITALFLSDGDAALKDLKGHDVCTTANRDLKPVRNWLNQSDKDTKAKFNTTALGKIHTDIAAALRAHLKTPTKTVNNAIKYASNNHLFALLLSYKQFRDFWAKFEALFPPKEIRNEPGDDVKVSIESVFTALKKIDPKILEPLLQYPALPIKEGKKDEDLAAPHKTVLAAVEILFTNIATAIADRLTRSAIEKLSGDLSPAEINNFMAIVESRPKSILKFHAPNGSKEWLKKYKDFCEESISHFDAKIEQNASDEGAKKFRKGWIQLKKLADLFGCQIKLAQLYHSGLALADFKATLLPLLSGPLFPSPRILSSMKPILTNSMGAKKSTIQASGFNNVYDDHGHEFAALWALLATSQFLKVDLSASPTTAKSTPKRAKAKQSAATEQGASNRSSPLEAIYQHLLAKFEGITPPLMQKPRPPQSSIGKSSFYGIQAYAAAGAELRTVPDPQLSIHLPFNFPKESTSLEDHRFVLRPPPFHKKIKTPAMNSPSLEANLAKLAERLKDLRENIQEEGLRQAHVEMVKAAITLFFARNKYKITKQRLSLDVTKAKVLALKDTPIYKKGIEWLQKANAADLTRFEGQFTEAFSSTIGSCEDNYDAAKEAFYTAQTAVRNASTEIKKILRATQYYRRCMSRYPASSQNVKTKAEAAIDTRAKKGADEIAKVRKEIWGIVVDTLKPLLEALPKENVFIQCFFTIPKGLKARIVEAIGNGSFKMGYPGVVGLEYPSLNVIGNLQVTAEKHPKLADQFQAIIPRLQSDFDALGPIKALAADVNRAICNFEIVFGGLTTTDDPFSLDLIPITSTGFTDKVGNGQSAWESLFMLCIGSTPPQGNTGSERKNLLQKIEDAYFTQNALSRPAPENPFGRSTQSTNNESPHNMYENNYMRTLSDAFGLLLYYFTVKRIHIQDHIRALLKKIRKTSDIALKKRLRSQLYFHNEKYNTLRDVKHESMTRMLAAVWTLSGTKIFAIERLAFGNKSGMGAKLIKGMLKNMHDLVPRANYLLKQSGYPTIQTVPINPAYTSKNYFMNRKEMGLLDLDIPADKAAIAESLGSVDDSASSDWAVVCNFATNQPDKVRPYDVINRHAQACANMAWKAVRKQANSSRG